MKSIGQEIRQFIIANILFGQEDGQLSDDDSLLEKGVIDSTGVLELVVFLEEKYQIKVADEELVPSNLDSVNFMVKFIEKKLSD